MTEVICPACQARYRVPEGAIGPKGRRVKCSACGEVWRVRGTAGAVSGGESPGTEAAVAKPDAKTESAPAALAGADVATVHVEEPAPAQHRVPPATRERPSDDAGAEGSDQTRGEALPGSGDTLPADRQSPSAAADALPEASGTAGAEAPLRIPPAAPGQNRDARMAEIRRMLNELRSPASSGAEREENAAFAAERDLAGIERMAPALASEGADNATAGPQARPGRKEMPDAAAVRQERAEPAAPEAEPTARPRRTSRNRVGAGFAAGFLLVGLAVALLALVYIFHAEIIARLPETEPALRSYVAQVDDLRATLGEQYIRLRDTLSDLAGGEGTEPASGDPGT